VQANDELVSDDDNGGENDSIHLYFEMSNLNNDDIAQSNAKVEEAVSSLFEALNGQWKSVDIFLQELQKAMPSWDVYNWEHAERAILELHKLEIEKAANLDEACIVD